MDVDLRSRVIPDVVTSQMWLQRRKYWATQGSRTFRVEEEEDKQMGDKKGGGPTVESGCCIAKEPGEDGMARGKDVSLPEVSERSEKRRLDSLETFQRGF